jgi:hypothetical protein
MPVNADGLEAEFPPLRLGCDAVKRSRARTVDLGLWRGNGVL